MVEVFKGSIGNPQLQELQKNVQRAREELLKQVYGKGWTPEKNQFAGDIPDVLHSLKPRQRVVIELRFGLNDGQPRNYREIAQECEMTPREVKLAKSRGLRALRHHTRLSYLEGKDPLDFLRNMLPKLPEFETKH